MKKILATLLTLTLCLALAACGSGGGVKAEKDLENVQSAGVLKIGMECAYVPFNWTQGDDSNGAVKIQNVNNSYANGYDVQIAQKVADALGVTLEIYAYEWDALIPALQAGTLDGIIAGMSPTAERWETIDFSSNYYVSNLVVIVEKDGPYAAATELADFAGAKINAQDATFHVDAAKQIENVTTVAMKDFTVLYTALSAGTIDGYIAEEPTAYSICAANEELTYVALKNNSTGFTCDEGDTAIAVGLRKNSSLNDKISAAIDAVTEEERAALMQEMVALAPLEE